MAKVTAPLLSAEAHGALGGALVFTHRAEGPVVKLWSKPTDERTAGQDAQRSIYAAAVAIWNGLSEEQKAAWAAQAAQTALTGFNLALSHYLQAAGMTGTWRVGTTIIGGAATIS